MNSKIKLLKKYKFFWWEIGFYNKIRQKSGIFKGENWQKP